MMLTDYELRYYSRLAGGFSILPYPEDRQFQPASIDLLLGDKFLIPVVSAEPVSVDNPPRLEPLWLPKLVLNPGDFVLASTRERVSLSPQYAARVEGRSTLGRMGITVHVTAGFIDPGFDGTITLEVANLGPWRVELTPGMRIAQLCVYRLTQRVERPYGHPALGSKYQNQAGVAPPAQEK